MLFADRARQVDAGFVLDDQTGPVVAGLVRRLDGMPLAIELAAARVEALGVGQLLDRLDDRFALLTTGDRLAPSRQRSLTATVEWSYRLLEERRAAGVPRGVGVPGAVHAGGRRGGRRDGRQPGGAAAGGLLAAGAAAGRPGWPSPGTRCWRRCVPTGPRCWTRRVRPRKRLPRWLGGRWRWLSRPRRGLETVEGELAAARWLDAEDATMRQVLAWGMEHDAAVALRLAVALGRWWYLRGRLAGQYPLLREVAGRAEVGSDGWCAAQFWLGYTAQWSADLAASLSHFTALRDAVAERGPCRALADGLAGRSEALSQMGRYAEAAGEARRALAVAREVGYPAGEVLALAALSLRRLSRRRPRQCRAAGPAGRADHRRHPRLGSPALRSRLDHGADRGRGPGRRRARLRGGPGPVPRRGRPVEPGGPAGK